MDFSLAEKELERAKRCIYRMEQSKTYDEYDESWSDFLSRIENIFTKIKLIAESDRRWNGFISPYNKLRANDELLSYLKQARNSVHHGISEISKHIQGGIGINPAPGENSVTINSLHSDGHGNIYIDSQRPVTIKRIPDRIEAVTIVNRQQTFAPPNNHKNIPLTENNPIIYANHAIDFYTDLLTNAKGYF
ncbi:TPA: hypothetical protein ACXEPV_002383 [Klebsiella pneumoniae]|uniref:hypothetical protein n=1 Tax=Klebsiella pneumoniae complex TaxID=3390273 RepID=UPI0010843D63|nr:MULTISPECIES: hypothetical protein [Klebsiella]MBW5640869.1 hypothetical protein [Klebsiella pneumoniae]MCM6275034.1 hypothetical protein [Klebsiella pneumoniae]MDU2187034.1 hypothetical protein [Klebsiella pneumoniae]CAF2462469.1 hypothetical protein AI2844V1_2513 [Klebsiella pneumoniae]CAH5255297.1 hypothetical protein AI2844V1_2513 [Klebsiella pneumoniae]